MTTAPDASHRPVRHTPSLHLGEHAAASESLSNRDTFCDVMADLAALREPQAAAGLGD
jgi:hypothetical protein